MAPVVIGWSPKKTTQDNMARVINEATSDFAEMMARGDDPRRGKQLMTFAKVVKGRPELLWRICEVAAISGHALAPELCAPVSKELRQTIMRDFIQRMVNGMKVNGKTGHWSNGTFGSRWCDIDAKKYGCDYIRAAFFSDIDGVKPEEHGGRSFVIQITVEKEL